MNNGKPAIAVIAEDRTDCETFRNIVHKVLGKQTTVRQWGANGCSILKRKLPATLKTLHSTGCNAFIIVHDLDRNPQNNSLNDEKVLRQDLEVASSELKIINKHICIPIEELEAWFLSDPSVIEHIGKIQGKEYSNPESISKPKELLIKLSVGENKKYRYTTNMNPGLIEILNFDLCARRCAAFKNLLSFLNSLNPSVEE